MDFNKYFSEAEDSAHENYLSYGGDDTDWDGDFSFNGGDGTMNTGAGAPTSQPYIITLSNTTTNDITSNIVGKAFQNITASSNGVQTGMTYTMGISGVTYLEFLYQQLNKPFVVGMTYIDSSSASQALKTLLLKVRDANGNEQAKTLVPTIDPYQQQTDIVALRQVFKWDGFTSVTIDVSASSFTTLYFYPSENVNISRGLAGNSVARQYGNPNVVRQDKVVLGQGVARALRG